MLILTQDRYLVCAERTIESEIILDAPDGKLLGDMGHVESCSVHLEMVLVLVQDRCTVCAKRTIGSDIVLDATDWTSWRRGSWGISFSPFGDGASVSAR